MRVCARTQREAWYVQWAARNNCIGDLFDEE